MKEEKKNEFKDLLLEELELRINEIESPNYNYIPRLKKMDYVGMVILGVVCIGIIVGGII